MKTTRRPGRRRCGSVSPSYVTPSLDIEPHARVREMKRLGRKLLCFVTRLFDNEVQLEAALTPGRREEPLLRRRVACPLPIVELLEFERIVCRLRAPFVFRRND